MSEENDSIQPGFQRQGDPIPYVTQFVCAVCGLIFIGLNLENHPVNNPIFQWAAPGPIEIFAGRYWGLLTAPFVHIEIWHVAFNVYWFWILGRAVEREVGRIPLILLTIFSAVTAAGAELAVADTTGIGLSGVVYAVFGFMWMGSRRIRAFADLLPRQTVGIFLVWLVACYIATETGVWNVANAAHLFGLLFGMAAGEAYLNRRRVAVMVPAMVLMLGGAVTACFWNPWSPVWLGEKALKAHRAKDYPTAIAYYRRFIARGVNIRWALFNLTILYSEMKDQPNFEKTLEQLRKVDPDSAKKFEPEAAVEEETATPPAKGK